MCPDNTLESAQELDAVFFYGGILDAYNAVGVELIGPNVVNDYVIPKMVYYLEEFLPELFSKHSKDPDQMTSELKRFLSDYSNKIEKARETGSGRNFSMNEIWELRAAIFGYESVFIDILGEAAIKNYVFKRIADILSAYLPDPFISEDLTLEKKLKTYTQYIKEKGFVEYANYKLSGNKVTISANRCAFAKIHDSNAYRNANVRFCPWAMIGSAILTSHRGKETTIESCLFTTKGSVSKIISE